MKKIQKHVQWIKLHFDKQKESKREFSGRSIAYWLKFGKWWKTIQTNTSFSIVFSSVFMVLGFRLSFWGLSFQTSFPIWTHSIRDHFLLIHLNITSSSRELKTGCDMLYVNVCTYISSFLSFWKHIFQRYLLTFVEQL